MKKYLHFPLPTFHLLSSFLFLLAACAPAGANTLTVMTHDSFAISEDVITAFETANNVDVVFLASGDWGLERKDYDALHKAAHGKEPGFPNCGKAPAKK